MNKEMLVNAAVTGVVVMAVLVIHQKFVAPKIA
jgi:hypothetical protein